MRSIFPLEIYISDAVFIGFLLLIPGILLFIIGIIFLIAKQKKSAKVILILSGCLLLISAGLCGLG
ncbi:hypothetical protein [Maribacter sp. 2210JD10-5]|uniref:hypothetical protein n=1 Tax=Maribacter sp. 2210JD10-5 TaxID=3386272 RepID=UPI0039BC8ECC